MGAKGFFKYHTMMHSRRKGNTGKKRGQIFLLSNVPLFPVFNKPDQISRINDAVSVQIHTYSCQPPQ